MSSRGKPDKDLRLKIISELKSSAKETTKLVSQLIQFNTENPPVNDNSVQYFIKEKLEEYGAKVTIHNLDHEAVPLTSSLGRMASDNFILYGHADVVPAGDLKRWKYPPFSGKIMGDKIYGRGAADMKGGLAAEMVVYALLAQNGAEDQLSEGISFVSVLDEENWLSTPTGLSTSEWLLDTGKLKGRACLMGEPSSVDKIMIAERGDYWAKLTCTAEPRHGSLAVYEENPNIIMFNVLNDIYKEVKNTRVDAPDEINEILTGSYNLIAKDLAEVVSEKTLKELKTIMNTNIPSMNVGTMRGGSMINIVPDRCEAELAFEVPIGMKVEELHKLVSGVVARYKESNVILNTPDITAGTLGSPQDDPSYTSPSSPLVKAIQRSGRMVLHKEMPAFALQGGSDATLYRKKGIDTVHYGPASSRIAHSYDEWVSAKDVVRSAEVMLNTIFEYDTLVR